MINPQATPNKHYLEYSMPAYDAQKKPDYVMGSTMNSARKVIDRPCLLINKLNVRKKRIWYIENPGENAVCSAEFIPIYSESVNLTFLAYAVTDNSFTAYLEDCSSGSSNSQKRVMPETIMNANIDVPSPAEQKEIGSFFFKLDRAIALHQSKAKLWNFVRFSRSPISWEQRKLGDIYTERNEPGNANLPILSVSIHSGVSDGELSEDDLGKNVRRSEDKTTYKHVYDGDLIFNMMRAWQGAIGVAKGEGMISPAYISAIPNDEVYPPFMDFLLKRADIINQINNLSYGVTDFRKRLYWDSFVRVKCMLPSVDEQKKIANTFIKLDRAIALHQRKKRYIEYYRNRGIFYAWI